MDSVQVDVHENKNNSFMNTVLSYVPAVVTMSHFNIMMTQI